MATVGEILKGSHWFTPISETEKRCEKHGIDYTEQVFKHFVRGCPKCREEEEAERERQAEAEREAERRKWVNAQIERRIGASKIPPRFVGKTVKGYEVSEGNEGQRYVADRVAATGGNVLADVQRGSIVGLYAAYIGLYLVSDGICVLGCIPARTYRHGHPARVGIPLLTRWK